MIAKLGAIAGGFLTVRTSLSRKRTGNALHLDKGVHRSSVIAPFTSVRPTTSAGVAPIPSVAAARAEV